MRRPYGLPSLGALASFEAAARHESFQRAASELNVTPAAVSHQVKALEGEIGRALFTRHHRGVALTDAGAVLFAVLQRGFASFGETIEDLRQQSGEAVSIRVTTAVSALWLTPRLGRFGRSHEGVAVEQRVSDTPHGGPDCDLTLSYGRAEKERGDCRRIHADTIVALGSPDFAARHGIGSLEDLARVRLVHLEADQTGWTTWPDWFAALGHHPSLRKTHSVNNYTIALQAAEDGLGAVLGWEGLTRPLIESGRLAQLLPHAVPSPLDLYIRARPNAPADAILLRDWLVASG